MTVVAQVRNPLAEKMLAVSLCLSVVGARTDSRSSQVLEMAPGSFPSRCSDVSCSDPTCMSDPTSMSC